MKKGYFKKKRQFKKTQLLKNELPIFQTIEQETSKKLFSALKKQLFDIPISVRLISFSLFLFMLGWGLGADTFFSLYIKEIVDNVLLVSLFSALYPLSKMFFALAIGEINDHSDLKRVLFISKILYIIAGTLFFFAGLLHSPWVLGFAVVFNGFASATMFNTYETYMHKIAKGSLEHDARNSRGLYFSSINAAYVLGALVSYFLIKIVNIEYLYLFIVLFSIISLSTDKMIPILSLRKIQKALREKDFLRQFFKEVFSFRPFVRAYKAVKTYQKSLLYVLGFELIFNFLNYVGFIFIPIAALANNLSLSEIALIFAAMKLPYLTNFFTAGRTSRYHKKQFILMAFLFMSLLYITFAFNTSFVGTIAISFGIAMGIAIIRPILSALLSENINVKNTGQLTGVQQFIGTLGSMAGVLIFGLFSKILGIQYSFLIIGIGLFLLAGFGIRHRNKRRYG